MVLILRPDHYTFVGVECWKQYKKLTSTNSHLALTNPNLTVEKKGFTHTFLEFSLVLCFSKCKKITCQ